MSSGEIRECMDDLTAATEEFGELAAKAAIAEVKQKVAHARWLLKSEGSVAVREAQAIVATEDELLARRIADARLAAQSEVLRSIRARLDSLRTLAADARLIS